MAEDYTLARVVSILDDDEFVVAELLSGNLTLVRNQSGPALTTGEVLLLSDENDVIHRQHSSTWPASKFVGVVKSKQDVRTILEVGGSLRSVPTNNDVDYEVDNTIEASSLGVLAVVDAKPISVLDSLNRDFDPTDYVVNNEALELERYDDFGGHPEIVDRAKKLIDVPFRLAESLEKIGARSIRGVLFTGPPGTGKTKLARIIANECNATFYSVSGPQVLNKWYGSSEKVIRELFDHAKTQGRAIIFFDEIDSLAGKRDEGSHEASRRVVAQLLTSMDGLASGGNVIVVATSNRPGDIDRALRRPGRFDWTINFPFPNHSDRISIMRASSKNVAVRGDVPFEEVAMLTEGWSSAELTLIWSEAALIAAMDGRSFIHPEDVRAGLFEVERRREEQLREEESETR